MQEARRDLMAQLLEAEFEAFLAALGCWPAALFGAAPPLGHSPAWHALHVMDWTRATVAPDLGDLDPAGTYGYLGSEDAGWIRAVTGPTLASEQDSQPAIVAALDQVFTQALAAVRAAPPARFTPEASFLALGKRRAVLGSLSYHLRHAAYHRGQLALGFKGAALTAPAASRFRQGGS